MTQQIPMSKTDFDKALQNLGWVAGRTGLRLYRFKTIASPHRLVVFTSLEELSYEQQLEELKKKI